MFGSLAKHHAEIKTYIFLVDHPDDRVDYSFFAPAEVVIVDDSIVEGFSAMVGRYTIIELNTAIRPFVIRFLNRIQSEANKIYYLDPDLYIYDRLDTTDAILSGEDVVITPHFLQPVPIDGYVPFENLALNYGTYNMGFFGLNPQSTN